MSRDPLAPHRARLLGLAYRMLGSRIEAEDVLQDAFIRFTTARNIENEGALLVTIVTRLCLDRLKSAKARRETYIGPWLPEPVLEAHELSPQTALERADDLSFALMLALERLSALERAAFLLHDVFDRPFTEIAAILGRSAPACRQLAARARKAVRVNRSAFSPSQKDVDRLLPAFIAAAAGGDLEGLKQLLCDDAMAITDGGGAKRAALRPIVGADKVARLFAGLARKIGREQSLSLKFATINGEPGLLLFLGDKLDQTIVADVKDGRIATIYIVRNPEKLTRLSAP